MQDTKGRDFWVAFMPNLGSGDATEFSRLRFYIVSEYPTTATIEYNYDKTSVATVEIPKSNVPVEVDLNDLFGDDVELLDVKDAGELSKRSLHVTSPDEITLCGIDIRYLSSDAFLVLPTDILSTRYMVLAFQNGFNLNGHTFDTPSQFAIVATEDRTEISITPGDLINARGDRATFPITLNAGDVFLGQASLDTGRDVSGTDIRANKPVAVFAGCKRACSPTNLGNFRDLMIEQIPPLNLWDTEAIITPFYPINSEPLGKPTARIIAEAEGTEWWLDGVQQPPLHKGQPIEISADTAHRITASDRILVAQFERSGGPAEDATYGLGDPFMTFMPSPSGFGTEYAFQNIEDQQFVRHFINVVAPLGTALRLDTHPITDTLTPIPTTRYGYAQIEVSAGGHRIIGDSAFGLVVYGFGRAISYGYPGGMAFTRRPLAVERIRPSSELSLNVVPNPVASPGTSVRLTVQRRTDVAIDLCDEQGDVVLKVPTEGEFDAGVHTIMIDLQNLPNGTYVCRGTTSNGERCSCRIIVCR